MRRPSDLQLTQLPGNYVRFSTACGTASGVAVWKDWGYDETHYGILGIRIPDAQESLVSAMEPLGETPGQFRVLGRVSSNHGWTLTVQSLGFEFVVDAQEVHDLGLMHLTEPPKSTEGELRFKEGVLEEETWVLLEITDLSL